MELLRIITSKMPKRSRSARSRIVNLGKYIPKTKKPRRLKVDHDKENVCDASAAWAAKKYRGHRVVPNTILDDLARAMLMNPVSTVLDDDDVGNDAMNHVVGKVIDCAGKLGIQNVRRPDRLRGAVYSIILYTARISIRDRGFALDERRPHVNGLLLSGLSLDSVAPIRSLKSIKDFYNPYLSLMVAIEGDHARVIFCSLSSIYSGARTDLTVPQLLFNDGNTLVEYGLHCAARTQSRRWFHVYLKPRREPGPGRAKPEPSVQAQLVIPLGHSPSKPSRAGTSL
ncbi:hypothetical protein JOM56_015403 [Amanita muscaria]